MAFASRTRTSSMIDSQVIEVERAWKQRLYNSSEERLDGGDVPTDSLPNMIGTLADCALGVAICERLDGDPGSASEWLSRAVDYYLRHVDATIEYEDQIEGSHRAHRPKYCADALHATVLADEQVDAAVERTLSIDESWYLDTYAEFAHVFHYVRALAFLLSDRPADARSELDRHDDLEETFDLYEAATGCVGGILANDVAAVVDELDALLAHHHDQHGRDPSAAVDFVSVEAGVLFACARDRGIGVSDADLHDPHTEYLLRP